MISRISGEAAFTDLRLFPQAIAVPGEQRQTRQLPIAGWTYHVFGVRQSDHGAFEVEAVSDQQGHIQIVLLAHHHAFYEPDTPEDSERRAFHEGVISSDLAGQREFSWGQVFCRFEVPSNKDWLVLAYALGPQVRQQAAVALGHLSSP